MPPRTAFTTIGFFGVLWGVSAFRQIRDLGDPNALFKIVSRPPRPPGSPALLSPDPPSGRWASTGDTGLTKVQASLVTCLLKAPCQRGWPLLHWGHGCWGGVRDIPGGGSGVTEPPCRQVDARESRLGASPEGPESGVSGHRSVTPGCLYQGFDTFVHSLPPRSHPGSRSRTYTQVGPFSGDKRGRSRAVGHPELTSTSWPSVQPACRARVTSAAAPDLELARELRPSGPVTVKQGTWVRAGHAEVS